MRAKTFIASVFLISICGCASSAPISPPVTMQYSEQRLLPGHAYEVETIRPNDGAAVSYRGKIEDVDSKSVVFDGAMKTVKVTESLKIPVVGKLFKNTGMGMETLKGKVRVNRNQITAIRDISNIAGKPIMRPTD